MPSLLIEVHLPAPATLPAHGIMRSMHTTLNQRAILYRAPLPSHTEVLMVERLVQEWEAAHASPQLYDNRMRRMRKAQPLRTPASVGAEIVNPPSRAASPAAAW